MDNTCTAQPLHTHSGFTLVELAIVLVIIGLIVGGVLVGQDLINAARIRSVITDIRNYDAAALTFREKYGGLPGDLMNTKATQFGFNTTNTDAARDGTPMHGDNDGKITGCAYNGGSTFGCESALFWVDLSKARLLGFKPLLSSLTAVEAPAGSITDFTNAELAAGGLLPKTKLRDTVLITLFNDYTFDANNYYWIAELQYVSWFTPVQAQSGLTPLEALAIDRKLDDGEPVTGNVLPSLGGWEDDYGSSSNCVSADHHYNTGTDAAATTPSCSLLVRPAF